MAKQQWNGTIKWIAVVVTVALFAIGGIRGYAVLGEKVEDAETDIKDIEVKVDANTIAVIRLETDVKYIRKAVDDSSVLQQQILTELRK